MALTCRELIELLGEYRAGNLDAEASVTAEAHLMDCLECTQYLKSYEAAIRFSKQTLSTDNELVASDTIVEIVGSILSASRKSKRRRLSKFE